MFEGAWLSSAAAVGCTTCAHLQWVKAVKTKSQVSHQLEVKVQMEVRPIQLFTPKARLILNGSLKLIIHLDKSFILVLFLLRWGEEQEVTEEKALGPENFR